MEAKSFQISKGNCPDRLQLSTANEIFYKYSCANEIFKKKYPIGITLTCTCVHEIKCWLVEIYIVKKGFEKNPWKIFLIGKIESLQRVVYDIYIFRLFIFICAICALRASWLRSEMYLDSDNRFIDMTTVQKLKFC